MLTDPVWIAALCALVGLVMGGLTWMLRSFWRMFRKTDQFLEDWNGVLSDNRGHDGHPGVMQRLAQLEHGMLDVQVQVHMNGGGSLRDEIKRTEANVGQLQGQMTLLQGQVSDLQATVDRNHEGTS